VPQYDINMVVSCCQQEARAGGIKQWVCLPCGHNMIGTMPDVRPFRGARHDRFATWREAERIFRVTPEHVRDGVSQLRSLPRLGLPHGRKLATVRGYNYVAQFDAWSGDFERAIATAEGRDE